MMRRVFPYFLAALLVSSNVAATENNKAGGEPLVNALKPALLGLGKEDRGKATRKVLLDTALSNVNVANDLLRNVAGSSSPFGRLIENLNLKLKALEGGEEEEGTALAVNYDYQKAVRKVFADDASRFSGIKGGFAARGNVAFQSSRNPRDFLDTALNLSYFSNWGGVVNKTENTEYILKERYKLVRKLTGYKDFDKLLASDEWRDFKERVISNLSDQYYLSIALDSGLESDQRFETKQLTFGLDGSLVLRGWGQDSFLGKINIFDYVPALLRVWSGQDSQWSPRGSGFPTFYIGLKRVLPQDADPRSKAGDGSDFWRYEIDIGFSSLLGRWKGQNVTWGSNFRHYSEINSDNSVKRAGLDNYTYLVTSVTITNGMFVSYSTGKLPFDTKSDQIYELGFSYQF